MAKWTMDREKTLDDFARKVEKGEFHKMPYCVWRDLYKKYPYQFMTIETAYNAKADHCGYVVVITHLGERVCQYCCETNDGSFGSYIQKYIDKDEKENMTNAKYLNLNVDSNFYNGNYIYTSPTISNSVENMEDKIKELFDKYVKENDNKKEENKMNTSNLFNFEFGPVANGAQYRMSPYGLAVRTQANGWVAYNAKSGEMMDVDVLNFDISKMIYKMPVALSAIQPGDVLIHGGKPVFVRALGAAVNTVSVIDYATASIMDILPVKSPFGFNFFTKVCPLFDMSGVTANADNPFGNMLPFLMLSGEDNDFDPTLLFLAGGMGNMDFTKNPMMLYFLMNRKDKSDMLPFLMMMNGGIPGWGNGAPATPASASTAATN